MNRIQTSTIYKLFTKVFNSPTKYTFFNVMLLILTLTTSLFAIPYSYAAQAKDSSLLKNAISLRQAGKTQQALDILESLKTQYIDHKRVNIELVMNYINFQQYENAQGIILHLKSLSLSPVESTKLQSLQKKLNRLLLGKRTAHRYAVELFVYGGIDSISSKFPVYEYSDFDDWQEFTDIDEADDDSLLTRGEESESKNDYYSAQQIKAIYRYQPDQQINVFGAKSTLRWTNHISLYQQQLNSEYQDNYGQIKVDSTLALIQNNKWLIDLRLRGRYHFNDNKHQLSDQGIQLSLTLPITSAQIKLGLEYRHKSFNGFSQINDATIATPWLEYAYIITEHFKLRLGSRYRQKHAADPFNSYDNVNLYMSLQYYINTFSAFVTLSYDRLHYEIDDPEQVNWSNEQRKSVITGLKYKLTKHLSFGFNSHFIYNNIEKDNGEDEWHRFEGFISYRF